jgi:hypothetical protein
MPITSFTRAPEVMSTTPNLTKDIESVGNTIENKRLEDKAAKEKAENDFLSQAKVDPVYTTSTKLQEMQLQYIKQFEDNLKNIYKKSNNRLTLDDRMQIQQQKIALAGRQIGIQKAEQEWTDAYKKMKDDFAKGLYDEDHFNQATEEFHETGDVPTGGFLQVKPGDTEAMVSEKANKLNKFKLENIDKTDKNGVRTIVAIKTTMDQKDAEEQVRDMYFNNGTEGLRFKAGVHNEFLKLPVKEQQEYLDKFKGNEVEAYLQFAKDKHAKQFIYNEEADTKEPTPGKGKKSGASASDLSNIPKDPNQATDSPTIIKTVKGVRVGNYTIASDKDYEELANGPHKDDKDAVRARLDWNKKKLSDIEIEKPASDFGNINVPSSVHTTFSKSNFKNEKTGEPIPKESGVGDVTLTDLNVSYKRIDSKGNILTDDEPGGTKVPFVSGIYKGKRYLKRMTPDDDNKIKSQANLNKMHYAGVSEWNRGSDSNSVNMDKLKENTYGGMHYEEAFKRIKSANPKMTDDQINQALYSKIK